LYLVPWIFDIVWFSAGAGCNVAIAACAIDALGLVMESDEAMALLFDVPAIQLRCSLPEEVSRAEVPLKSAVMLADSDSVALQAQATSSEHASAVKYGPSETAPDARIREELLLLVEVRSIPPPLRCGNLMPVARFQGLLHTRERNRMPASGELIYIVVIDNYSFRDGKLQ
jgi:hypothetical protein